MHWSLVNAKFTLLKGLLICALLLLAPNHFIHHPPTTQLPSLIIYHTSDRQWYHKKSIFISTLNPWWSTDYRKLQRKAYRHSTLSLNEEFTAYGQKLERVEAFKYLGRLLTYDSNNIQDVRSNLEKARIFWARISEVLRGKNMSPKVCGIFIKWRYRQYYYTEVSCGTSPRWWWVVLRAFTSWQCSGWQGRTNLKRRIVEVGLIQHQRTYLRK